MRANSSEVLGQQSNPKEDIGIRPKGQIGKTITQKDTLDRLEDAAVGAETLERGRAITGQKAIYQPTKEEWDHHKRSHIPFLK